MSKKTKRFGMQKLEEKAMMAGDVSAAVVDGDLHINEMIAGQAQDVQVYKLSNGGVRVQGLNGTQVYGNYKGGLGYYDSITFYGVDQNDDLVVNLGNGNDRFTMLSNSGGLAFNDVSINVGGNTSWNDADTASLSGLTTSNALSIQTGAGDDHVSVSQSTIGDSSWEDLTVNTGAGADTVDISTTTVADNVVITTYADAAEADADSVTLDFVTADGVYAYLGNGDDEAALQFSDIDDDVVLDLGYDHAAAGQDDDYLFLGFNNVDDDITIHGRDGNDEVRAAYNVADDVDFNGGDGYDQFFRWILANGQDSNDFDDLDLDSAFDRLYGYV